MATSATYPIAETFSSSFTGLSEYPPLTVGDRVVWLGNDEPEHGTVRWLGLLPKLSNGWTAGIELDNPAGGNDGRWGGERLFVCKENHGILIGLNGLIKEVDFLGNGTTEADPTDLKNIFVVDEKVTVKSEPPEEAAKLDIASFRQSKDQDADDEDEDEDEEEEDQESSDSESSASDADSLAVDRLLKKLELAICCGKVDEAAASARDLAQLKIQCLVVHNRRPAGDQEPSPIIVHMFVEDKVSHFGPIPIRVVPSLTVGELKKQIFRDFEFPVALQRWIIGRKLASDNDVKLSSLGVDTDGCPVFLYLLSFEDIEVKAKDLIWENDTSSAKPQSPNKPKRVKKTVGSRKCYKRQMLQEVAMANLGHDEALHNEAEATQNTTYIGWQCESCTMINDPTRPGCQMCGAGRPTTYVLPSNYRLSIAEWRRMEEEEKQEKAMKEAAELERLQNWQHYLDLDDRAVIYNDEVFECSICFNEAQPGEGVKLRDCLHVFCCDCLRHAIVHCEDAEVICPYRDDQYSCQSVLQEREIRALVSLDVLEKLLQRSMARAESQAKNSFHCKTPDCQGWCLFEDNANEFSCPVCLHLNCITCRAIHEGMNCRQYQDKLMILARTDEEAKKTTDAIEVMLQKGEAQKCPNCQVIIMKKWGCDWVTCSFCKTEICWVTKGPRWGPLGRGDTSGGCKCGVRGVKCHPNCQYCH